MDCRAWWGCKRCARRRDDERRVGAMWAGAKLKERGVGRKRCLIFRSCSCIFLSTDSILRSPRNDTLHAIPHDTTRRCIDSKQLPRRNFFHIELNEPHSFDDYRLRLLGPFLSFFQRSETIITTSVAHAHVRICYIHMVYSRPALYPSYHAIYFFP